MVMATSTTQGHVWRLLALLLLVITALALPLEPSPLASQPFGVTTYHYTKSVQDTGEARNSQNLTHEPWKRADGGFRCFVANYLCCWTCCPPSTPAPQPSTPGEPQSDPAWTCTGEVPTLDEMKFHAVRLGLVQSKTSVFYTDMGGDGAIKQAKCWFSEHDEGIAPTDIAHFNNVFNDYYFMKVGSAIAKKQGWLGTTRFQKLMSQAFAEMSSGKVFVFMPQGKDHTGADYDEKNTWKNWEYPALTRNEKVIEIRRVDPRVDVRSEQVWQKANGPSSREPLGRNWPVGI
ncbi:Hypothetical protein D9617_2g056140 [Elsinoe fawcettii]|nr:Hypothetical protein D9617_2g056140 [Elsinoe fawcettii]